MSSCPYVNLLDHENYEGGAPHAGIAELRDKEPVYWQEDERQYGGGVWVITSREHIDYVSKNPALFSSRERTCVLYEKSAEVDLNMMRMQVINMDPPEHLKHRRLLRNVFTPAATNAYRPRFEATAKEVVDRICEQRQCEFVQEVAAVLPLVTIGELMGIPEEDRQQFFGWTNSMLSGQDPEMAASPEDTMNAAMQVYMYGSSLQEKQHADPVDNLMGQMVRAEVDGERLTSDEINSLFMNLIAGGVETTRTVTTHGMRLLIEHPEQLSYLQENPEGIADFIEEVLRFNAPINFMARTAMQDIELGGKKILKGQQLIVLYHGANHEAEFFNEPERFDVTRPQREDVRNGHRAFGIGQHFCIGSHLARLQLLVVFSELIPRIANPRFIGDTTWLKSYFLNSIKQMPIAFDLR
jgi:cholest-4-en-3-one 26-monooxygenase